MSALEKENTTIFITKMKINNLAIVFFIRNPNIDSYLPCSISVSTGIEM